MGTLLSSRPIEYSKLQPLGEGASSTVYRALRKDIEFGIEQEVAVKILKSQIATDDWRDEFALLSVVNSNRCVRVLSWDHLDGNPALILELVHGVTVDNLIRHYHLSPTVTEELTCQIFEGLQDISRAGISHGDLSLKNVMVNDRGEVKILDFGLYKGGRGQFTPEFAAPEIFEQEAPTFFSDLYSLGRIKFFIESKCGREISATTLKMLALRPTDRDFTIPFIEPEERNFRRENLARLVGEVMNQNAHMSQGQKLTTVFRVPSKESFKKWLGRAACAVMLTLGLGQGAATADLRPGYLYIRTSTWSELKINDLPRGYSPLDIEVPSNETLKLEFKTPNGTVLRTLTVSPGQNIVLGDGFLKAHSGEKHGSQLVE
jgi:serine/threonine protein kinase